MALADSLPVREPERPRILIVRLSALGDIVFATSLLDALRSAFPLAHIAWLAQKRFAAILEDDPRLDELIAVDDDLLNSPAKLWRLRRELTARRFDWALEAQGLAKSQAVLTLAGGARRIGFESKEPLGFVLHHRLAKGGDLRDISSEYRFMAQTLTGRPAPPPRLIVPPPAATRAAELLREAGLEPGFIAFCPFTTRPQKHWMEDYWPALAERLDRPCAVFGGPNDRASAEAMFAAAARKPVNLAGRTRLQDLAALLSQAGAVVGVDTGLTHIGIAVQRPAVALFGSTCPYTQGAESPLTVLYDALPCSPCKRNPTCAGRFDCMRALTPERVAAAVRRLLPNTA